MNIKADLKQALPGQIDITDTHLAGFARADENLLQVGSETLQAAGYAGFDLGEGWLRHPFKNRRQALGRQVFEHSQRTLTRLVGIIIQQAPGWLRRGLMLQGRRKLPAPSTASR
jgi:hypothetical protein